MKIARTFRGSGTRSAHWPGSFQKGVLGIPFHLVGVNNLMFAQFRIAAAAVFAVTLLSSGAAGAAGRFECPADPLQPSQQSKIKTLLPNYDSFAQADRVRAAIDALQAQQVRPVFVIDNLVSAYCQSVNAQTGLNDQQKSAQVSQFAARLTHTVYSINTADQIVFDVAVPRPDADAIYAKARSAGVQPEAWLRSLIEKALR
jgi:hypothetical protein